MSEKVNQLCKIIASNPAKINLLNDAIKLGLAAPQPSVFRPIVDLLRQLHQGQEIIKFRDNKLMLIFVHLLQNGLKHHAEEALELLSLVFGISSQKEILSSKVIEAISGNKTVELFEWPSNIMIHVFEQLALDNQKEGEQHLTLIESIITELPSFSDLDLPEDLQAPYKKNFQKLLISTLANPNVSKEALHNIYHNLGEKVLSKLQNPLILSNTCLDRFANDSELQIEVLSCIFLLVGKYGLELEQFYPKLQKLVRKRQNGFSIYQLPNSRRFFKLLEASLRSSRVPFKTISAFAHLLLRQLPGEQSEFAFWSLSFIVNLTKKHRKLLDELPLIPQLKVLKYHYNHKIRALVQELSKNMNKIDYLEIEEFGMVDCQALNQAKMASLNQSLDNEELQFKIPAFEDPI